MSDAISRQAQRPTAPKIRKLLRTFQGFVGGAALAAFFVTQAQAVPAFTAQTGQPCSGCHVGAFGPQLQPFARQFKLEGYTMRGTDAFVVPVSAMAIASYLHTSKDQNPPPAPHFSANDNAALDQISVFLAGGIGRHFGGFVQTTYDPIGRNTTWDNLDLRAVTHATIAGSDTILGLTFNNSPGVQDVWNTLPAWGFAYTGSGLAPSPAASTVFDGGFAQTALGTSAYVFWDSAFYLEGGAYWSPERGILRAMGMQDHDGVGTISGAAPYIRLAYQKNFGASNFELGAFGFFPRVFPGADSSIGTTDDYADIGIDGSYQYIGDGKNTFQINGRYTHENQKLGATFALGDAAKKDNSIQDARADASYYWHNLIGGTVEAFTTWGSSDTILYGANRTFNPDSTGLMLQADVTPFANGGSPLGNRFALRIGVQYTTYFKFNGAGKNWDTFGANASDNDAARVFLWTAF